MTLPITGEKVQVPLLRPLDLLLQRQLCSKLERISKVGENIFD
jgi:hypothetical protein